MGCKSISDQELQGTGNILFAKVFPGQGCYQVRGSVWRLCKLRPLCLSGRKMLYLVTECSDLVSVSFFL